MNHPITLQPQPLTTTQPTVLDLPWILPADQETDDTWRLHLEWSKAKDAWLAAKRRKSNSQHTVDAYQRDWTEFFTFAQRPPWLISSLDADTWRQHLEEKSLKQTTINRKLAAVSSFYTYVSQKYTAVGADHVERSLYIDTDGNPRLNPFSRVDRYPVEQYQHSDPIHPKMIRKALLAINQDTLTGSRDFALILTYIYTGRRSNEIAQLKWGDIQHDDNSHRIHYTWSGKGGKTRTDELPPPVWHAINHFLRKVGRLETIQPGHYIFQPVHPDRAQRLPGVQADRPDNRHIQPGHINRIVKRRFVAVGIPPEKVHTHTLRHTAAHLRYRDGDGQDLLTISKFLNHSNVSVTQIYLSKKHKPIDDGWTAVEQLILLP